MQIYPKRPRTWLLIGLTCLFVAITACTTGAVEQTPEPVSDEPLEWFNSPGGSSEAFRCYLARDLSPVPGGRPVRDGEERDMPLAWVPLADLVAQVLAGSLHNPLTVAGVLAAYAAQQRQWSDLRPADAPWPVFDHLRRTGRLRDMSRDAAPE